MHPVTDFKACAWMKTGIMRREQPSPRPCELVIGVFDSELMGQGDGDSVLLVPLPDGLGKFHLLNNFRHQ